MIDNKIWNKYVNSIKNIDPILKDKIVSIFEFIEEKFPELVLEIKWNEPMFLFNNSFIIAFSVWKNHVSISPEKYAIDIYIKKNYYHSIMKSLQIYLKSKKTKK